MLTADVVRHAQHGSASQSWAEHGYRHRLQTYRTVLAGGPRPNDIVVTVASALAQGTNLRTSPNNHVNMKTAENINLFLDRTIPLGQ